MEGRPVEVPVAGLHQTGNRTVAVSAVRLGAKVVDRGQGAAWGDFEDRAALVVGPPPPAEVDP